MNMDASDSGMMPPNEVGFERSLIAAVLAKGTINADVTLQSSEFYDQRHGFIWQAAIEIQAEHGNIEVAMLNESLTRHPSWKKDGFDAAFVLEFAGIPGTVHQSYHADKIRDASKRRQMLELSRRLTSVCYNGFDSGDINGLLGEAAVVIKGQEKRKEGLPTIEDSATFLAEKLPLPPELVQGLLHQGSKLCLGGSSKSFTTWTLQYLAIAVAYGLPWLGLATKPGRVLLIDLELQKAFLQRRLSKIMDALGVKPDPDRLLILPLRGHAAGHDEVIPRIIAETKGKSLSMILLDPVYKLYAPGANENAAGDMAQLFNNIEKLGNATGAATVWRGHYSKGNQAGKESIDRVSGSGVSARDPDSIVNLAAHQEPGCFTFEATRRRHVRRAPRREARRGRDDPRRAAGLGPRRCAG